MYKMIRIFNQNRKKIIKIILVIVLIILIINIFNYFFKNNVDNNVVKDESSENIAKEVISTKSAISGQTVFESKLKNDVDFIKKFINYCIEQNIDSAYEMLTNECKEEMFNTKEDFFNNYCLKIFDSNKQFTIENWSGDIYLIKITQDILATGKIKNESTKQDYITVVNKDGESKLNINNYIGRKEINKVTERENIKIYITEINTYMDYEIYSLVVENGSENKILLDAGNNVKSVYLLDNNKMKYYFFSNEIVENKLIIESKFKNKINIKFSNSYSSDRKLQQLVFSEFVLNYDEFKKLQDVQKYNYYEFKIDI